MNELPTIKLAPVSPQLTYHEAIAVLDKFHREWPSVTEQFVEEVKETTEVTTYLYGTELSNWEIYGGVAIILVLWILVVVSLHLGFFN